MSLLSVTVKKARYVSIPATQFNTYVTLKLQNVKSTTVTVKGPTPCWEQDFLFEINDINLGLLVEVWNKGVIWDRSLGYHYLPLTSVAYNDDCGGRCVELEAQLMMRGGAVVGTTGSTGHTLLLDCRFEPPFDAEGTGGADLQRKLDLLNGALDAERAEQARRQMQYIAHSGYSEDSDYTSDLNYPVGQHPNCSASQFRNAAHQMHTPQRSLEVSRENSYERDEYHMHGDTDPLYYNSQPRNNRIDTWSQFQPELRAQASVDSAASWRTATDWQSGEDQRRPSLERQNTLYDDIGYGYDYASMHLRDHTKVAQQQSYEEYYDSSSYPYHTTFVGDDSKQWDSGGNYFYDDSYGSTHTECEKMMNKRRSSVVQLPQVPPKQLPASSRYSDFNGMEPYRPRQRKIAASLPATPSSTPKRGRVLPLPPGAGSLTGRSTRGRRLPQAPYQPPASVVLPTPIPSVPYRPEPANISNTVPTSYGYDGFGYQNDYQDTTNDYHESTYNSSAYDEDGMQPFFDETPHATPPAAAHKLLWNDPDNTTQFTYPVTSEKDNILPKSLPTPASYMSQRGTISHQEQYPEDLTQQKEDLYSHQANQYYQHDYELSHPYKLSNQEQQIEYQQESLQYQQQQSQYHQDEINYQKQTDYQHLNSQYQPQRNETQQLLQHQQQPKQPAQQLQTSVLTGAATLGSLMAGGAKKLGSLFGAAAAAVAPPPLQNSTISRSASSAIPFSSTTAPVTSFSTTSATIPLATSNSEVIKTVPVSSVTSSASVALPRAPSLRRQESIQLPPVVRTRTLPEAPEDLPPSSFDESAYDDEYEKTEYDEPIEHDRLSLNKFKDNEYNHDIMAEEHIDKNMDLPEEISISKIVSPTRNSDHIRKPSVDSYHAAPTAIDRRTSQSSFHHEDTLIVPTTQEDLITEKSKVKFQEERTTYHEVPHETDKFHDVDDEFKIRHNGYHTDRESYHEEDDQFPDDENEKFDDQDEPYNETEDVYQEDEDGIFHDKGHIEKRENFQEKQPKLTAKQRWHWAFSKVMRQLNVAVQNALIQFVEFRPQVFLRYGLNDFTIKQQCIDNEGK